jgi:beta-lactamase superfamily II metal-dependent hydrolase
VIPRLIGLVGLVVFAVAPSPHLAAMAGVANGRLQLHYLDVGQGDAAVIVSPQGQVVLVDNGVLNQCGKPVNYLSALAVSGIEGHVASHYHADHIGCTEEVLSVAPLVAALDRGGSYSTQTYQRYLAAIAGKRNFVPIGTSIPLDSGVSLDFIAANGAGVAGASDENDLSVVMRVRLGEFSAVFGGDLSGSFEGGYTDVESAVAPFVGSVDVYKVHHHGSRYSSNATWLQTTKPRVGVVSVGANNSFGHPAPEALARLHAANVRTFWTSIGKGATPVVGRDTVAGDVVIEVAPGATTFDVRYGGTVEAFPVSNSTVAPPDPPTDLAGTVLGATVALSWTPPTGGTPPTSFLIEAAFTSGGPSIANLPVSASSVSVSNVPNGTYFVRVRSVNAEGVSAPSNEIVVTVGSSCASPPAPPTNLTGAAVASLVTLGWSVPTSGCPVSGYVVRAGSAPNLTNVVVLPVGNVLGLQATAPPGTYFVTVTAQNAFGTSAPSNEAIVTIGPSCTLPGAPATFNVGSSGSTATLSWTPPTSGGPPAGYVLEAGSAPGLADLASLPLGGLSFSSPAAPGTYFVRVKAQNACGVGPASSEQVLTMACIAPGQPSAPSAGVSGSTANLSWSSVAGATGYQIAVGTAAGASNILNTTVSGTTRQLSGLANGTYFARVRALNACGSGTVSGEGMFAISVVSSPTCNGAPAPSSASCGVPTAVCRDGTYSCSQNRSGTCSYHGGVSCWICPGRLC